MLWITPDSLQFHFSAMAGPEESSQNDSGIVGHFVTGTGLG